MHRLTFSSQGKKRNKCQKIIQNVSCHKDFLFDIFLMVIILEKVVNFMVEVEIPLPQLLIKVGQRVILNRGEASCPNQDFKPKLYFKASVMS